MSKDIYDNIVDDIVNNKFPVLIYFFSTKLIIDSKALEFFNNLKNSKKNNIIIHTIDIDLNSKVLSEFEITTIPAIICFKNNKEYFRFTGTQSKNQLSTILYLAFYK
ncbi:hypothetical protein GOQ27_14590 [Clostridium sp. D2Q-11]|uniref:Thioredoxin domain-containing protein n=1 Tax=Anaeromonas frigoriresistens TaxID=2683708 RepID=A0A942UUX3_9FIRM|nr:thioredoxin domain-containing protein [Anaeromonas frigoriresistens]MBS4539699.1 hypothetical protein [Anaeromonas frigoriresistens]